MKLRIHYDLSARDVLTHPDFLQRLQWMKDAGVHGLWLSGYYFGRHESDPEQMARARLLLEDEGFETGVISLPVGHPGNSLNPDDPTLDLAINPAWRYRVNRHGHKEYFSACIEETMAAHNRKAAQMYAQMGFTQHFFDDDLRLGNDFAGVNGCFCDACIDRFNVLSGARFSRVQLAAAIDCDPAVREAWRQFNCDKLTGFMRETVIPGMTSGIMVMYNGGRNHGISIPDIKKAVPGCLFRVGEWHFDDHFFTQPGGKEALSESVRHHLSLIGDNPAYSETTVFPANALSPENWIEKMRLEIRLGLRNLFLMSGSWFFSEPYWRALQAALPELNELAERLDAIPE